MSSNLTRRGRKALGLLLVSSINFAAVKSALCDDHLLPTVQATTAQIEYVQPRDILSSTSLTQTNDSQKLLRSKLDVIEKNVVLASYNYHIGQADCDETLLSCDDASCDDGKKSCPPWWSHRSGGFGEFLYLSPGNSDLIYAREETDPLLQGSPTGPLGILNVDASPGFRAGFNIALDRCSSLFSTYTRWDGSSSSQIEATGTNILNPLLLSRTSGQLNLNGLTCLTDTAAESLKKCLLATIHSIDQAGMPGPFHRVRQEASQSPVPQVRRTLS